jgi:hypothetical protein
VRPTNKLGLTVIRFRRQSLIKGMRSTFTFLLTELVEESLGTLIAVAEVSPRISVDSVQCPVFSAQKGKEKTKLLRNPQE